MQFAHPLPWWLAAVIAVALAVALALAYRRPLVPLAAGRRAALVSLRALSLAALVLFLLRPVRLLPPASTRGAIVPILIDTSRSMRLTDGTGESRLARAAAVAEQVLLPALSRDFDVVVQQVGDGVAPATLDALSPQARRSDLAAGLEALRERYRGQPVAGIVLISDGGDTSASPRSAGPSGPPVYMVGVGASGGRDREIVGVAIGDPKLDQASVDLRVSAVASGYGRAPFEIRLLADGVVVDTRRVAPVADGTPVDELFTVSPNAQAPTVFTAEIPAGDGEEALENNVRSVLASPAGRRRRVLMIEGAPGYEHAFLRRALGLDPVLEIDSVTRKGANEEGEDTFFVQGASRRVGVLASGFPSRREDLFAYDAIAIADVEADFFTRDQLGRLSDFVSERGGGLLVLGGRSFDRHGLPGTPLEPVLPVELNDRRGVLHVAREGVSLAPNKVALTFEGEMHPVTRLGDTPEQTRKLWAALPALAGTAAMGAPRPGATVLAVAASAGGLSPVIAVQRFGQGRSMVFAGEASWRWKMMLPSTDRTYEMFWRHALRWLSGPAPDPVSITVPDAAEPGDTVAIGVQVRDAAFIPVSDAGVDATLTKPDGTAVPLVVGRDDAAGLGRFSAPFRPEAPGVYRVRAEARRGATLLGRGDAWLYVGGADREFADPRLNEGFLQRAANASGGRYVPAGEAASIVPLLRTIVPRDAVLERRDLWHRPWAFGVVLALLVGEWTLRRRWGLR
ncbi:MAG: hypothetical protein IT176_01470 [Acidobacteria bacterium]|nr:hypothetical protein [Acidobacteriota bacterium]